MELELRRFSVTLKRLLGGVDFDLLSSIVPCLPLSTEYCIYAGRWRLLYCQFLFQLWHVRVYYCCTLSVLWFWKMYPFSYNVHTNAKYSNGMHRSIYLR